MEKIKQRERLLAPAGSVCKSTRMRNVVVKASPKIWEFRAPVICFFPFSSLMRFTRCSGQCTSGMYGNQQQRLREAGESADSLDKKEVDYGKFMELAIFSLPLPFFV